MIARRLVFLAPVWLFCAGCGGDASLSPEDVVESDLYGWWISEVDGNRRVIGFAAHEDALFEFPRTPLTPKDVLVSYDGDGEGELQWLGTMYYSVEGGELKTSVIDSPFGPGGSYSQSIIALTPGERLTLEVFDSFTDPDATTERTYTPIDRCPLYSPYGYTRHATMTCVTPYAAATSVAYDAQGRAHFLASVLGEDTACEHYGHYGIMGSSCDPQIVEFPRMRSSDLAIGADEVHAIYTAQNPNNVSLDGEVFYRARALDSFDWTTESLGTKSNGRVFVGVTPDGEPSLLFVDDVGGRLVVGHRAAGAWSLSPAVDGVGSPFGGSPYRAALSSSGRWVFAQQAAVGLGVQAADGSFETWSLPRGVVPGHSVAVAWDEQERVHVAWPYEVVGDNADGVGGVVVSARGSYAILDDGVVVTEHDMGLLTYPTMPRAGVVVHAVAKAGASPRFVSEVDVDEGLVARRFLGESSRAGGTSPEFYAAPDASMSSAGEIAGIGDGNFLWLGDGTRDGAGTVQLTLEITGQGRVYTDDGLVDCDASCVVDVPAGQVVALRVNPGAAREVLKYLTCYGYESVNLGTCSVTMLEDQTVEADF